MGGGSTLTNRSSRLGSSAPAPINGAATNNGARRVTPSTPVPLRRLHDGSPNNYRAAYGAEGDDGASVKSNTGLPPRYVLPCLRLRSRKAAALAILATAAIFVSMCSAFLAYHHLNAMSLSSSSSGQYFLPTVKEWGAGRERRKRVRLERREHSSGKPGSKVKAVKYSEYEAYLLNYLFSLRAEGVKAKILPLKYDPPGRDMSMYTNLGCSVFNQLNDNPQSPPSSSTFHKEQMRRLWSSHLSSILVASRTTDDAAYLHQNWTATLLTSLHPDSMLDHLPEYGSSNAMSTHDVERIVGLLVKRYLGLLQSTGKAAANTPPPLRIAVFGGPTVEGKGCHRARVGIPSGSIMANPAYCAFPHRLEQFLNAILLPPSVLAQLRRTLGGIKPGGVTPNEEFKLVEVINLGEEGTGSDYSTAIVRNRQYPPPGGPPDLVIDAYGIDDFGRETSEPHSFYDDKSLMSKECSRENKKSPPVIVRAVLEEDASAQWQTASSVMTAVLGEAVDDVEEGEMALPDTQNAGNKAIEAGGAFGMAGHAVSAWTLAFNLAYAAIGHCGSVGSRPGPVSRRPPPRSDPKGCDNGVNPPCIFSFLAGAKGTSQRPSAIASSLMPFIVENTGWQPESDMTTGFARKTGLVGTGTGATMTLLFRNITRPIGRLDVISLRSTSEAWKDGSAQFVVVTGGDFSHGNEAAEESSKFARETSFEVSAELIAEDGSSGEGRHISYHFGLDLPEGETAGHVGTDVLLRIILTKGSRFKILGLMLCE